LEMAFGVAGATMKKKRKRREGFKERVEIY
jgi:hypothetical protein